jgi:cell volume regulation protein A
MKVLKQSLPYFIFISIAIALSLLAHYVPGIQEVFTGREESIYLVLAVLFAVGYGLNYFAPKTAIPSFVWAIFFGMALQPLIAGVTQDSHALKITVELLAALVLFAGGVEVPFVNFKKYFAPIASISLFGTLLTVFMLALGLEFVGGQLGYAIPAVSFLILAAILASIDPASIIPSLKHIRLKRPFIKDVIISESAVNDVAGSILTRFFLVTVLATAGTASVLELFGPVLSRDTLEVLALEVIWGVMVGLFSAWILRKWAKDIHKANKEVRTDPALFFAVPIFAFAGGSIIGGSGFLAAFVAGLLFDTTGKPTQSVQHFFEVFVNNFIKPIIFLLLGAITPISVLLATAGIGIIAGLLFIFVIRPLVVFITLAPWSWAANKSRLFSIKELMFMSFVRETGAIPAVLMLVALAAGIPYPDQIFAIGMWIILMTLIVEPPLTPYFAKHLGLTVEKKK